MAGRGRPTRYRKEFAEQAFNYCLLGAKDDDLARFFGVSEQTINTWKQKHPEFLESIKSGKDDADANVARSLYKRATGYEQETVKIMQFQGDPVIVPHIEKVAPDTTAAIFWLKNRRGQDWRDKQEHHHSGSISTQELTDDELERIAAGGSTGASGKKASKE